MNDDLVYNLDTSKFPYPLMKVDTTDWIQTPFGLMAPELYDEFMKVAKFGDCQE